MIITLWDAYIEYGSNSDAPELLGVLVPVPYDLRRDSGTGRENQASLLACKYLRSCRDYDPVDEDLFGEGRLLFVAMRDETHIDRLLSRSRA